MNPLIIRRRGMMQAQGGGIPYQRIEYLELTAQGPRIDLGVSGNGYCEIDCIGISASSTSEVLICTRTDVIGGSFFGKVTASSYWSLGGGIHSSVPFTTRAYIEIAFNPQSLTAVVNGDTPITRTMEGYNHYGWFLFANSNSNYPLYGRIFSFKGYDYPNHDLIIDLLPVRVGTVGYMYDRVSGQLFGNNGTGAFVLGPDVI